MPLRDTRDPHFLLFRDRLFLYSGTWYSGQSTLPRDQYDLNLHLGYAAWTADGNAWNSPILLEGTFGHYIWRAAAHGERVQELARVRAVERRDPAGDQPEGVENPGRCAPLPFFNSPQGLSGGSAKRAQRKKWDAEWGRVGREGYLWNTGSRRAHWALVMGRSPSAWFRACFLPLAVQRVVTTGSADWRAGGGRAASLPAGEATGRQARGCISVDSQPRRSTLSCLRSSTKAFRSRGR